MFSGPSRHPSPVSAALNIKRTSLYNNKSCIVLCKMSKPSMVFFSSSKKCLLFIFLVLCFIFSNFFLVFQKFSVPCFLLLSTRKMCRGKAASHSIPSWWSGEYMLESKGDKINIPYTLWENILQGANIRWQPVVLIFVSTSIKS